MKIKKIPPKVLILGFVFIVVLVIVIRFIISITGGSSIVDENVAKLNEMENTDIADIESEIDEMETDDQAAELSTQEITSYEDIEALSGADLNKHYKGTVLLGDSITNSIVEYEILGRDIVVSDIGLSVAKADDEIDTAIGLNPSTIIMCFGANDLETYVENSDKFIAAYLQQIKKLKKALPGVKIYINGILPIEQSRIDSTPALGYYEDYNTALQQMCQENQCTYIDSSILLKDHAELYEPDGEHMVYDFYPKWLTYMAEKAGL